MTRTNLELVLRSILESEDREQLDRKFLYAIRCRWGHELTLTQIAVNCGSITQFNRRGLLDDDGYLEAVATCFQHMQLSLDDMVEMSVPPFNRLHHGSTVVVVVGQRPIQSPGLEKPALTHYAVGARDSMAYSHFSDFIDRVLRRDCRIKLRYVRADVLRTRPQRVQRLKELLFESRRGALICIGSPVVNPLTDLVAELMFSDDRKVSEDTVLSVEPPARFVWPRDVASSVDPLTSFLSCPRFGGKVGIVLRGHDEVLPWRDPDAEIQRAIEDTSWKDRSFADCGIVMADLRNDNRPLAICLGHGGMGTLAASYALTTRTFGRFVTQSETPTIDGDDLPLWYVGKQRVFQVVTVARKKPTAEYVDDMVLDFDDPDAQDEPFPGKGWDFYLESAFVDVLDEDGRQTGRMAPAQRVHQNGEWHWAVHVVLVTPDRKIVLQKRGDTELLDFSASGHVDAGESTREAAVRELTEELGLGVEPSRFDKLANPRSPDGIFTKEGCADRQGPPDYGPDDVFRYAGRDRRNRERNQLFGVRLSQQETEALERRFQGNETDEVVGVEFLSVECLEQRFADDPDQFASGVRQYFQHSDAPELIRAFASQ